MENIGDLMQEYYLCLSGNDVLGIVDKLHSMEDVQQYATPAESSVINEIVSDCQKKTAQHLRSLHSESVRNMITAW